MVIDVLFRLACVAGMLRLVVAWMIFILRRVAGYGLGGTVKFGREYTFRYFGGFGGVVGVMGTLCVFVDVVATVVTLRRRVDCCCRVMLGMGSSFDGGDCCLKVCEKSFVIHAHAWLFAVWLSWFVGTWMGVVLESLSLKS